MALLVSALTFADDVTFDFDNDYQTLFPNLAGVSSNDSHDGDITETVQLHSGAITMTVNPADEGKTPTRIWGSSPRLRIYSGQFTIESSADPITYIKFEVGSNWNVTASTGTLSSNEWSGSEQSVVFTVSKNSQIKSVTVSTASGHTVLGTLYDINFKSSQDGWTILDKSLPEGLSYVWKPSTSYGYVASAYVDNAAHPSESWILSPIFDLSKASDLELSISHAGNKFSGAVSDQVTYYASTDEGETWSKLNVETWPAGNNWNFVSSTIDVAAYTGKPSVRLAVAYVSTEASAGSYELAQLTIKGNGEIAISQPATAGPTITPEQGTYDSDQTVTITDPTGSDYTIYYTLDGTDPTEESNLYEGSFTVSETTTIKAVYVDDDDNMSDVTTTVITINKAIVYTTAAELIKNCTATSSSGAPAVTFTVTNLLVTGVNGSNVFVSDQTGAFLLYGSGSKLSKGDIISGTVAGNLYAYNGLPELAVTDKWANITVASQGNAVEPVTVNAADITAADASRFVRLEGLTFVSVDSKNYTLTDGTTSITLRDNFNNLSVLTWNEDCKYNLNVFVIPYKETLQYYAVSADDIEVISTLDTPDVAWANDHIVAHVGEAVANTLTTNSDGTKTYASSNEEVATVAEDGTVTIKATGVTTITVTIDKTATYMGITASYTLSVVSNADGTADNPYTVGDLKALFVDGDTIADVWVKAYIVGFANGAYSEAKAVFGTEEALASNILIAASADETNYLNTLPVALETKPADVKAVRDTLNLKDHPENLGKEIWLKGSIIKYFSVAGLKSVNAFSFTQPTEAAPEDVNGDGTIDTQDVLAVYDFMSTYQVGDSIEGYDVNGDGTVDTQDVLTIYGIMQNQ